MVAPPIRMTGTGIGDSMHEVDNGFMWIVLGAMIGGIVAIILYMMGAI